jgi:hypothetical protein
MHEGACRYSPHLQITEFPPIGENGPDPRLLIASMQAPAFALYVTV